MLGISDLLDKQVNDGTITPEQKKELTQLATTETDKLALVMNSTKGMTKKQQEAAVEKMKTNLNDLESKIPGVKNAMSKEAITAKGKFGDADSVNALFSTGRGGGVIEDPTALASTINQRARKGKGGTKKLNSDGEEIQRPATFSGDNAEGIDPENKPTSSEWLTRWEKENRTSWEKKIDGLDPDLRAELERRRSKDGTISAEDLADIFDQDSDVKSYTAFLQDVEQSTKKSQKALSKADDELEDANNEMQDASVPVDPDTGRPVLRQYRRNIEGHIAADPTSRTSKINNERRAKAELKVSNAQTNRDNVAANHDANVQQLQSTQGQQPQQTQKAPEQPQQPQQAPEQPQQPQKAPEQPQQPQKAPEQPQQPQKAPEEDKQKKRKEALMRRMDAAGRSRDIPEYPQ